METCNCLVGTSSTEKVNTIVIHFFCFDGINVLLAQILTCR